MQTLSGRVGRPLAPTAVGVSELVTALSHDMKMLAVNSLISLFQKMHVTNKQNYVSHTVLACIAR